MGTLHSLDHFDACDAETIRQQKLLIIEHRMRVLERRTQEWAASPMIGSFYRYAVGATGSNTRLAKWLFGRAITLSFGRSRSTRSRATSTKRIES